jgi:mono/diheme cytochrome c family protein
MHVARLLTTGRRRAVPALVLAAVLAGAAACGSDSPDAGSDAPPDGASLYAAKCAVCHGVDLRGTQAGPPFLSAIYGPDQLPDTSFQAAVRDGVLQNHWKLGAMAPVAGLSDADVAAIVTFVRGEQQREGLAPYPPG